MTEVMEWRSPIYNHAGTIDCEVNHATFGWIPFTASPEDVEAHGVAIYNDILSSGTQIAPFVPPTQEELRQRMPALSQKQMRMALLARGTDTSDLAAVIKHLPNAVREKALIEFQYSDGFTRLNPSVIVVLNELGITSDADKDTFWNGALGV